MDYKLFNENTDNNVANVSVSCVYSKNETIFSILADDTQLFSALTNVFPESILDCFIYIIKANKNLKRNIIVNIPDEQDENLSQQLLSKFFVDMIEDNNLTDYVLLELMHLDKNKFNNEEQMLISAENTFNKWNNDIKLHILQLTIYNKGLQ